ncbi:hypothetical protein MJG53_000089 [Ovis ammon polii x Ovis aries]|nr:hypothetical protein MJG53_000089 [Ovis ammon polii x Ovis aries]
MPRRSQRGTVQAQGPVGLCLERGQERPPPSTHPNPIDVNGGGDASRSPESWAAGSPPTRPAVCSTPVCLSHHGFVRLLQHLKRYVCPRSLGSDHVSGDLRVARARALGPRVDPPPARERRGPIGLARGSQESVKLDLDFDLELELDLEIEFDLELELDFELDLDFDLDLDFELDLALELDLDFDLELELELDQQRETRFAQSTGEPGLWSMQTSRVVQGLRCPWVCGIFYTGIEPVFPASVGRFFTTGPSEMFPVPFY